MSSISYKRSLSTTYLSSIEKERIFVSKKRVFDRKRTISNRADKFFYNYERVKSKASFIQFKSISKLPSLLLDFEAKFSSNNCKVIFINNSEDFNLELGEILNYYASYKTFIDYNDIFDELSLLDNFVLHSSNTKIFNLNSLFSEYSGKFSKSDSQQLFNNSFTEFDALFSSNYDSNFLSFLKDFFLDSKDDNFINICGVDFLLSDSGGIINSDASGISSFLYANSKINIFVASVDSIVSSISDFNLLQSLKSVIESNHILPSNLNILYPSLNQEAKSFLFIVDNGRSEILKTKVQREILHCIKCSSCIDQCPVLLSSFFPNFQGPLSSVSDIFLNKLGDNASLSYACTLCGKCDEICPANISLTNLILSNRIMSVDKHLFEVFNNSNLKFLKKLMLRRSYLDGMYIKFLFNIKFKSLYGKNKCFPKFPIKSFRLLWQENH